MKTEDIQDVRLIDALRIWRIRPDSIGKKYLAVNVFPGHMSVTPSFHEDSLEIRVKMYITEVTEEVEWITYVIDLESNAVVYSKYDKFDFMPQHDISEIHKFIADKNMLQGVHRIGAQRELERYEFKELIRQEEEKLQAMESEILCKMYSEYVYEKETLGYPILAYGQWLSEMSDDDKKKIKDQISPLQL